MKRDVPTNTHRSRPEGKGHTRTNWRREAFLRDTRAAFKSSWRNLFVITTGISIFSWLARALSISLSTLMSTVIAAFRNFTHPIVDALFFWAPFELLLWEKDLVTIWLAIGGAVLRTLILALRGPYREDEVAHFSMHTAFGYIGARRGLTWTAYLLTPFLWPVAVLFFFATPYLWRRDGVYVADKPNASKQSLIENDLYFCDVRFLFAANLLAVALVVGILMILNAIGLGNTILPQTLN